MIKHYVWPDSGYSLSNIVESRRPRSVQAEYFAVRDNAESLVQRWLSAVQDALYKVYDIFLIMIIY